MHTSERLYKTTLRPLLEASGMRYERGHGSKHPYVLVHGPGGSSRKYFFPASGQSSGSAQENARTQLRRILRELAESQK